MRFIFYVISINMTEVESVIVCVNGRQVGNIELNSDLTAIKGYTKYKTENYASSLFYCIMIYVVVSFILTVC